ncbi:50S ribosomal protein L7ae, partial [Paenibacillus sp. 28ISP30-2]|nr:50S ribosomal protein L7ae [Paenibacillus sp. 28ISP30-2]
MNKALSGLGLAMRAGKLLTGDEIVYKAIRSSEA